MAEQAVLLNSLFLLVPIGSYYYFKHGKKTLREFLGLKSIGPRKDLEYGFLGAVGLYAIAGIATGVAGLIGADDSFKVGQALKQVDKGTIVPLTITQSFTEEVFFRGFALKVVGNAPQAVLFGAMHYGFGSVVEVIAAGLAGLLLGFLSVKRKSVYSSIAAHALYNLYAVLAVGVQ